MLGPVLLRTEALTRSFGSLMAVNRVDFTVHAGELRSIIGPNGAGKTTLFRLISGEMKPSAGRIWFQDKEITGWPQHMVVRLGIHREVETVVGIGATMLAGMGLVALSMVVMLRVTPGADPLAREDLAFALAVVLLGLLMMVTRRNAVSQVVGFMSLENGLILAATGAKGMPLVVEISVAFSILIAFIVIGIFLFRIRERFDTVDVHALDRFRGE